MARAGFHNILLFDVSVYRDSNQDLRGMSDEECRAHFESNGKFERRIFGRVSSTRDRISMRWLRGKGIEIGAGDLPVNLCGHAGISFADIDPALSFGGSHSDYVFTLDDPNIFDRVPAGVFDFAVASHVLEHLDSLLLGLSNLIRMVRPGGIIYIAVPSSEFDFDSQWMPFFDFEHHIEEFSEPLRHVLVHDGLIVENYRRYEASGNLRRNDGFHNEAFYAALSEGKLQPDMRYAHHKHGYDYESWTQIILKSLEYLGHEARLVDSAFGYERMDCNFVLERKAE